MTVGAVSHWIGVIVRLSIPVGSLVVGSIHVIRRYSPALHGAVARLAEAVLALSAGLAVLQLMGTLTMFSRWPVIAALAVVGVLMTCIGRGGSASKPSAEVRPQVTSWGSIAAVALTVGVVVAWALASAGVLRHGMVDNDTLRYHGPFVARWVRTHSITRIHHTSNELQEAFFPANSELLSGLGVLSAGNDVVTPLLNLGWLALALLGGWCLGRPGGRAPFTMGAVAIVAATPLMLELQPGTARNDTAPVALVIAALALFHNGWDDARRRCAPAAVALTGLALGLAIGTKLTVVVPVAVIIVGIVIASRTDRARALMILCAGVGAAGSFWYVRNWVRVGNPLPWYRLVVGPVHFDSPRFVVAEREGLRIIDYAGSKRFWSTTVLAGLHRSGAYTWPAIGLACAFGIAIGLRHRNTPVWALTATAAISAIAIDVITPYSAGGFPAPTMFAHQLRFLTFAATGALICAAALMPTRYAKWVVGPAVAMFAIELSSAHLWLNRWLLLSVVGAVVAAVSTVSTARRRHLQLGERERPRPMVLRRAGVGLTLVVTILGGSLWQKTYVDHRYLEAQPGRWAAYRYFHTGTHSTIAVGGLGATYPLAGTDLTNLVTFLGVRQPHGGYSSISNCHAWQRAIRNTKADYVVIGRSHSSIGADPREAAWTAADPSATLILRSGTTSVFRIRRAGPPSC